MTKLTNKQWLEIEELIKNDENIQSIAKKYKVTRKTIYDMAYKKGWLKKKNKTLWETLKRFF